MIFPKPPYDRGFGAAVAVMLVSLGTLALAMSVMGAAIVYSDSVEKSEFRLQKILNKKTCDDTALLIRSKDRFVSGDLYLPEFDCTLTF